MRKFFLLFGIALSLFFVLSQVQEGDRTEEFVLPQQSLLNITLGFPNAKYEVLVPQGSTVYDLLNKASLQYGFSFSGKSFPGMGFFVEEIKGAKQNPRKGLYWIYSINAKKAEVGVSSYILNPYDVITWTYENEE